MHVTFIVVILWSALAVGNWAFQLMLLVFGTLFCGDTTQVIRHTPHCHFYFISHAQTLKS